MTDQQPEEPNLPATVANGIVPESPTETKASIFDKPGDVSKPTPEEHRALFEMDLKENDWGHSSKIQVPAPA
jgi:hypothetical protein